MADQRDLLKDLNELSQLQPDAAAAQRTIERTSAALNAQSVELSISSMATVSFWRAKLMRPRNFIAIAVAAVILIFVTQWLPSNSGGNFAFAQVQEQVAKTKSVQYTETLKESLADGSPAPTLIGHVKILGDRVMRNEGGVVNDDTFQKKNPYFLGPWGPSTEIIDLDKKKNVTLYPEIKGYLSMDWGGTFAAAYILPPEEEKKLQEKSTEQRKKLEKENPELAKKVTGTVVTKGDEQGGNSFVAGEPDWSQSVPFPQLDIYELIRHVPTDKAQHLPEKTIRGKQVIGFLVEQTEKNPAGNDSTNWRHTWWVDPATKLPVQMEINWRSNDPKDAGSEKIISDIVFDAPLDPTLFSIDLPVGYTDLGPAAKKSEERRKAMANGPNWVNSLQSTVDESLKFKDGRIAPPLSKSVIFLDNLTRQEIELHPGPDAAPPPDGIQPSVSTQNLKKKESLVLLPDEKQYFRKAKPTFVFDYVEWFKRLVQPDKLPKSPQYVFNFYGDNDLPDELLTRLPLTTVEGQLAYGKTAEVKTDRGKYTDTRHWTIWVDPFTMHPIHGEASFRSTDPTVPDVDYVLRDFRIGRPSTALPSAPIRRRVGPI